MIYKIMADLVVLLHLSFILFVVLGGLLALRFRPVIWLHIPAFLWGGAISLFGWICPLTYLENDLRVRASGAGYGGGFIEQYILPVIYPERLFGDFPRSGFIAIGVFVLLLNAIIYWRLGKRRG